MVAFLGEVLGELRGVARRVLCSVFLADLLCWGFTYAMIAAAMLTLWCVFRAERADVRAHVGTEARP